MQNKPQLSAEMEKRFVEEFEIFNTWDWVEAPPEQVRRFLATALEEQRDYFIQEIRQVCKVHNYLPKEYEDKIVRFISNLDKPQPEISLTQKKGDV